MRPRESFHSEQQYNRYKVAVEYGNKMKELLESGYLVFDSADNTLVTGTIEIPDDDYWSVVSLKETDNCTMILIGFAYGDDKKPWIEETLVEIHKIFNSYKFVKPEHIQSLNDKPWPKSIAEAIPDCEKCGDVHCDGTGNYNP
jgi:hypothetical protein